MLYSIIIPAYNAEVYIPDTIKSILNQNFPQNEYEILVVDDCSTDKTYSIVKSLQATATNLTIIRHDFNKRQGGARNTGIDTAKGEWIFFVDSDDLWLDQNVLNRFHSLIKTYQDVDIFRSVSYTSFSAKEKHQNKQSFDSNSTSIRIISGNDYISKDSFFYNLWTSCYRKRLITDNSLKFREHVVFEDTDWATMAYYISPKVLLFDYPFYGYRTNPESVTNRPSLFAYEDNVTSAFILRKIMDRYEMGTPQCRAINNRIKTSIKTFVKLSRHYTCSDSIRVLKRLQHTEILSTSNYQLSNDEKVLFWTLRNCPTGLVYAIKMAYFSKRIIKKII